LCFTMQIQGQDAQGRLANGAQQSAAQQFRFWQDIPILVMVSMLAYFCFLELLLVCAPYLFLYQLI
uniref:Uncharacterized protein n=1 Tax=Aegilops tauschii subsp. strangulata TaxID=200361 RepID=A0A453SX40_AEGTS